MAVNYFAAALGFAAAGHCHLLKGKEKLSDADSEDCNKQLYFGMCVRKIEGQTKAQAVAEYLAQKPGALEEDELTVVVRALMKYWACPAESRGH